MTVTYAKHVLQQFWHSFTNLDRRYLFMVLYDAVFLFVAGLIIQLSGLALNAIKGLVVNIELDRATVVNQTTTQLEATKGQIQQFLWASGASIIAFVLLLLVAYALFKGLVWLTLYKQKPSWQYFKKFFLLNLLWALVWFVPWFAIIALIRIEAIQAFGLAAPTTAKIVISLAIIILAVHPVTFMQAWFTMQSKPLIKPALAAIFTKGYGQIHRFVVPYLLSFLVYLVLAMVALFLNSKLDLSARIGTGILFLAAILFINWFRTYLSSVIKEIGSRP